ncbi:uncharacterized protein DSM5745_08989 [Aspergillus mulundensis]|uniref:Cyclin-D1-binding protein 1-like N-terminal domain-containing protein n=1 Tax=Aspergillus mulundensis TaxID=1810919 RepID=A0A3D8QZ75_9EURO|nr:Uncharacterized protein DSM5745_08989 [Aspergillus mulundensis]RDW67123.1 Uncharacterized protein DSM5745_08989 [Aspergillus mulundensis]
MSQKLEIVLKTTLTLIEQFQSTLSSTQANSTLAASEKDLDPLPLLSTSSTALKSHVTKLSLLAINSPFTPSAVATTLSTLNESVLPSLVTAALLITPESHTRAFQTEIRVLTGTSLKELSLLVKEVQTIAEEKAEKKSLEQAEKNAVTAVAGRVWDACDVLVDVAAKGVVGFLVKRAEQYRDLVRDAVEEIEEWDPDEEGDEFFDDLLDGDKDESAADEEDDEDQDEDEEGSAALRARKRDALRILKPVAQIYPAIITNRLKKASVSLAPSDIGTLEEVMLNLQRIPDHIDEVAGALYEDDPDKFTRRVGKIKESAFKAIELVVLPWGLKQENAGDKFTTWSKTWTKVVEEVSKSIVDA